MRSILILDHDENLRRNLTELFGYEGFDVLAVDEPGAGAAALQQHQPDLILAGLNYSGAEGIAFIREIRERASLAQTPIIALSAVGDPAWVGSTLMAGADYYLVKPVSVAELIDRIEDYLSAKRG